MPLSPTVDLINYPEKFTCNSSVPSLVLEHPIFSLPSPPPPLPPKIWFLPTPDSQCCGHTNTLAAGLPFRELEQPSTRKAFEKTCSDMLKTTTKKSTNHCSLQSEHMCPTHFVTRHSFKAGSSWTAICVITLTKECSLISTTIHPSFTALLEQRTMMFFSYIA